MGEALRGAAGDCGVGRGAPAGRLSGAQRSPRVRAATARLLVIGCVLSAAATLSVIAPPSRTGAQPPPRGIGVGVGVADTAPVRMDSGRFTIVAYHADIALARTLMDAAIREDSFPGLPRPSARVVIAIAPDEPRFRELVGPAAPEWGAAVAMPASQRIVMRGRGARATAGGDPRTVLRHELAHLALHEAMGALPPRWFDEGYASFAAGEWGREELLATNRALLLRRFPSLRELDDQLTAGAVRAGGAYALSHRAVAEMAALDPERGLTLFFGYWKESGRMDSALRRAYGITFDGFEERWQSRTRNSYGVLALVGDITVLSLVLLVVLLPFMVSRARRNRERLAFLRRQDAILDAYAAAVGTTVDVLLGIAQPPADQPPADQPPDPVPPEADVGEPPPDGEAAGCAAPGTDRGRDDRQSPPPG